MSDLASLIFLLVLIGVLVMPACGATIFAAETAPRGRHGRMHSGHLVAGGWVAAAGLTVMALVAWSTHEDVHYDDFGSTLTLLAAIVGAATFVLGLGPFVPWLLGVVGQGGARLPVALRLSARHLADRRARTAPAVAATIIATAFAVAVATIAAAGIAQSRAQYVPQARPGALVVRLDPARPALGSAAVREELPGTDVLALHDLGGLGPGAAGAVRDAVELDRPAGRGDPRARGGGRAAARARPPPVSRAVGSRRLRRSG
ncbi:hypothetical protein AB0J71_48135 [Nonomuraea sp. NPDC049637]|uniref:hypothetical protein n=1 Tax=Nonomuraea sp. NPDC049637 TaxID=3154356 RepID=UPI003428200A